MSRRDQIEQQIRDVLASETRAIALSDRLFRPDGLFSQLAATQDERRLVAQTPLFQEAQRRLSDLQRGEAAAFADAAARAESSLPNGTYLLKLERTEGARTP